MAELNKARIGAAEPTRTAFILWDRGRLPGFGLKVLPTGKKVFILDTRIDGRSRRLTIGAFGALTLDDARKLASEKLVQVARGEDPTAARRAARAKPTVGELCDRYLEAAEAGLVATRFGKPKKKSTIAIDRGMIERHIKPLIGSIRVDKLGRPDAQRMIDGIASGKSAADKRTKPRGRARVTGGRGIATRTAELLGGIWSWGTKRGLVEGPSPVSGTDRFRSQPADRRLNEDELIKLGHALSAAELEWTEFETRRRLAHAAFKRGPLVRKGLVPPAAIALFRLIATTGMRPSEASGLKWDEIDFVSRTISLGDSKTGRSKRPLGEGAVTVLQSIDRLSDEWVFPASRGTGPSTIKKPLVSIFSRAGVEATPKTLRTTFASVAADLGYSGGTIGEILGHARQGVTERHYIRRVDAVILAAADAVSGRILSMLNPSL